MDSVEVVEVGPRDGLQSETRAIPAARKVALVDALSACGFRRIEAASFVSPRRVPQMADGAEVMARIARPRGTAFMALVPNLRGYAAARAAGADWVAVFAAATEGFSRANLNASVGAALERLAEVVQAARADAVPVRGYVSVVTDCPYEGPVAPQAVAAVAGRLLEMGCAEIALGETLGRATPDRVGAMLDAVLEVVPAGCLAGHFHDTGGRALANVELALSRGLRVFDGSAGGLGGCPYAPGAPGNLATEALVDRLAALGLATGIDRKALARAAAMARGMRQ